MTLTSPSGQAGLPGPEEEGCGPPPLCHLPTWQKSHDLRGRSFTKDKGVPRLLAANCPETSPGQQGQASHHALAPKETQAQHQGQAGSRVPDLQVDNGLRGTCARSFTPLQIPAPPCLAAGSPEKLPWENPLGQCSPIAPPLSGCLGLVPRCLTHTEESLLARSQPASQRNPRP